MLFWINQDLGRRLGGFLVPDNASDPGRFAVLVNGQEIYRGETTIVHKNLVAIGRHENGRCGFVINETHIPNLSKIAELDIVDLESGLTIYRRRRPDDLLQKKIFRFETHLLPLSGLDRAMEPKFQHWFTHADRIGAETAHQIFNQRTPSIYVSGRVAFPSVEQFISKGEFETIAILHEPFEELAERLLFLRLAAQRDARVFGDRDQLMYAETLDFVRQAELDSEKSLRRAFRMLDPAVAARLSNPVVRQLTTLDIGEPASGNSVSKALSTLASFSVVGVRRRPHLFAEAVVDLLSLPEDAITVAPPIPAAMELAETLREIPQVEDLLQFDLALYHFMADAFEKSLMESKG